MMMCFSSEAYQHLTKLVFVFLAHYKNSNTWDSFFWGGAGAGTDRGGMDDTGRVKSQTAARNCRKF